MSSHAAIIVNLVPLGRAHRLRRHRTPLDVRHRPTDQRSDLRGCIAPLPTLGIALAGVTDRRDRTASRVASTTSARSAAGFERRH